MESGFESGIIVKPIFWFVNIILIFFLLFALAFGYKHGVRDVLLRIIKSVLQIGFIIFASFWLTENFKLFSEKGFYEFVEFYGSLDSVPLIEVNKLRVMCTFAVYFLIVMVVVELIIGISRYYMSKNKKKKEKKEISKTDRVCGEIFGALLFMIWAALPAPLLISAEKTGFFTNGTDLINKTVMTVPVNYVVKPFLNLIAPESKAARLFEDGLEVVTDELNVVERWTEEQLEKGN
ncbi:MAG: hypothetical protein Q4C20_15555 [Erysipelotrichaceae bacterium]|nr:hypothetical protein [Erysipelotrichaceae bacterium]